EKEMTRKDYVRFSAMLKDMRVLKTTGITGCPEHPVYDENTLLMVSLRMAAILSNDTDRFLKACGVES
ncbi:unnamed protein product, partial [marine sediment metagenome]